MGFSNPFMASNIELSEPVSKYLFSEVAKGKMTWRNLVIKAMFDVQWVRQVKILNQEPCVLYVEET